MPKVIELSCLSVSQPIGTFYLAVMKAGDLLNRVDILRRGLDPASRDNVQRELSPRRAHDIAAYVTDPDATFPTSIIVSAYPSCVHVAADGARLRLGKPQVAAEGRSELEVLEPEELEPLAENDKIGQVIDGQHRLMGLELAGADDANSPYYGFELPVVFMLSLEAENRAYVFSTINSKQTRVSSSLIIDLFGLATSRSPRKTCHDVAAALNATKGGPFFATLKMLGRKTRPTESLTQGSFAKYLLMLVSRRPDEDERLLKLGGSLRPDPTCPLRQFFVDDRDDMIVKVMDNYFTAVREVYPAAWEDTENYALKRTVGFAALIRAFQTVWREEVLRTNKATLDIFRAIALRFAEAVPQDALKDIPSNEGGAGDLARRLTGAWLGHDPIEKP